MLEAKMASFCEAGETRIFSNSQYISFFHRPHGALNEGQNTRADSTRERGVLSQPQGEIGGLGLGLGFEYCAALLPSSLHQDCRHCPSWLMSLVLSRLLHTCKQQCDHSVELLPTVVCFFGAIDKEREREKDKKVNREQERGRTEGNNSK